MKPLEYKLLIGFECYVMDLAEALEAKEKDDIEWLTATLHEHLEAAMEDYASDEGIEDYECQY